MSFKIESHADRGSDLDFPIPLAVKHAAERRLTVRVEVWGAHLELAGDYIVNAYLPRMHLGDEVSLVAFDEETGTAAVPFNERRVPVDNIREIVFY